MTEMWFVKFAENSVTISFLTVVYRGTRNSKQRVSARIAAFN